MEAAPTAPELRGKLGRLARSIGAALDQFDGVNDYDRAALQRGHQGDRGYSVRARQSFEKTLGAARSALSEIQKAAEDGIPGPTEIKRNLNQICYATPETKLVVQCAYAPLSLRPAILSGSVGGEFHRFVSCVFEYATGVEGDATGVGLERPVKEVGALFRKKAQLVAEEANMDPVEYDRQDAELRERVLAIETRDWTGWI
jgi:hypothetical protein